MKCKHCGVGIANDSKFCEYCGTKVKTRKLPWWAILLIVLGICAIIGGVIATVISVLDNASLQNQIESAIPNDRSEMNIHGNVLGFVEKSYYTYTTEDESLYEEPIEGGLFDDATFLYCVYSDEHIARVFYKKWFLTQVSDCEIQFDNNGNVLFIKSIWDGGGQVNFTYDENQHVKKMDARDEAGNQDEGVVNYEYEWDGNQIIKETAKVTNDYGEDVYTISYNYDAYQNLMRAIMNDERGRNFFFHYQNDKICRVIFDDYWGAGVPASFQIEYNDNGDIQRITSTGTGGASELDRVTTFEYQYDSDNNWISRIGKTVFGNGFEATIKTERTYTYF